MTGNTPLVLIVNHHPDVVLLLERVVNDLGFESALLANDSDWQTDGYSALLAYINERLPHAVLFDLPPPYEEAAETLLRLIADSSLRDDQWVVLSTGAKSLERIHEGSGAATIGKPFDLEELSALLETATSTAGATNTAEPAPVTDGRP